MSGYRDAFDDPTTSAHVYYAGKAFLSTTFARWVREEGLRIDVCSGGGVGLRVAGRSARRSASPLHGNNKSSEELAAALSAKVGYIVVDSFEEIARLGFLAQQEGATKGSDSSVHPESKLIPTNSSRQPTKIRSLVFHWPRVTPQRRFAGCWHCQIALNLRVCTATLVRRSSSRVDLRWPPPASLDCSPTCVMSTRLNCPC